MSAVRGGGRRGAVIRAVAILLSLTALAAECNDPAAQYSATGEDANCPAEADVARATGLTINDRTQFDAARYREGISYRAVGCTYRSDTGGDVSVGRIGRDDSDGTTFEILRQQAIGAQEEVFEPLNGLGRSAWVDGERIAVRNGGAMMFIEFTPATDDTPADERIATSTRLARELLAVPAASGADLDCGAVESVVSRVIAEPRAGSSNASDRNDSAGVKFIARGCTYFFPDDRKVTVVAADSVYWDGWVAGKDRTVATEYSESTVSDHQAFVVEGTLIVDDGESPVEVRTSGLSGTVAERNAIAVNTAQLVL